MKIEEGKFYKTRDGRKSGLIMKTKDNPYWPFRDEDTMYYREDGYSCPGTYDNADSKDDLIEEWKEEKMSKFKVGDFVTVNDEKKITPDRLEIVQIVSGLYYRMKDSIGNDWSFVIKDWDDRLELAVKPPKSPVVEKTVKSIEPGVYGIVNINNHMGKPMLTPKARNYTPEELESAAKTFIELAEYLRGME